LKGIVLDRSITSFYRKPCHGGLLIVYIINFSPIGGISVHLFFEGRTFFRPFPDRFIPPCHPTGMWTGRYIPIKGTEQLPILCWEGTVNTPAYMTNFPLAQERYVLVPNRDEIRSHLFMYWDRGCDLKQRVTPRKKAISPQAKLW